MPLTFEMGISPTEHWDLFPYQVLELTKAYEKRKVNSINEKLQMIYTQACLTGAAMSGSKSFPKEAPRIKTKEEQCDENDRAMVEFALRIGSGLIGK